MSAQVKTGFEAVQNRLLKIGGREVKQAPGRYDPAIDELLRDGRDISLPVLMRPVEPQHCHANVARLWQQHAPGPVAISVGYALDADSYVWRQHWWGLATDIGIIETTEPRSRYFGIDFTAETANAVTSEILREFEARWAQ